MSASPASNLVYIDAANRLAKLNSLVDRRLIRRRRRTKAETVEPDRRSDV